MIYKSRKTSAGTEYWDTKQMKVLFVPVGVEPDFDVVERPTDYGAAVKKERATTPEDVSVTNTPEFGSMTVAAMKQYASDNGLTIPSEVTRSADIAQWLTDNAGAGKADSEAK